MVPSIKANFERAKLAGAEIVTPLAPQEDRGLFYAAKDPAGRIWNFGEYDPSIGLRHAVLPFWEFYLADSKYLTDPKARKLLTRARIMKPRQLRVSDGR